MVEYGEPKQNGYPALDGRTWAMRRGGGIGKASGERNVLKEERNLNQSSVVVDGTSATAGEVWFLMYWWDEV